MKYNSKYIFYCLLFVVSIPCFSSRVYAQNRIDKVRKRYAYLIEQAQEAYQNYDFDKAQDRLGMYEKRLTHRRVSVEDSIHLLEQKIAQAQRLLSYFYRVRLVDSIQFSIQDIAEVFAERSTFLSKTLRFDVDSSQFNIRYNAPLASFSLYAEKSDNWDLLRAESLLSSLSENEIARERLSENVNTAEDERNPFMLSTGDVLLFARKSDEGIGGYDLFYSRYNLENKSYYKAKILGMPFNSIYNDYLLAYDDEQDLSYLVSDRYCPQDSLVLYRFVGLPKAISGKTAFENNIEQGEPSDTKGLFEPELDKSYVLPQKTRMKQGTINLALRDNIVIISWEDFQSSEASSYYQDFIALKKELKRKVRYQKELRKRYRDGVLLAEGELITLEQEIKQLNKDIKLALIKCKNAEIRYRNK